MYHIAKAGGAQDQKTVEIDGMRSDASSAVPTDLAQKVAAVLSDAVTQPGNVASVKLPETPDIILRFKADAGTVDLFISVMHNGVKVFRDGKQEKSLTGLLERNDFRSAFITLLKKAFPDDPEIKALPVPPMSTADLVSALETAGDAYYDHYHAMPPTPENYVVAAALTGKTRDKQAFVELSPDQISASGEILDEWGTPLRFLFLQDPAPQIKVWSAGQDNIFGTADDIGKPKPEDVPGAEGQ